jgi:glycosyltransferase involved in cell wall biosynthesis
LNKVLLIHPGTQYSHQLAKQLFRKNLLKIFITGFVCSEKHIFSKLLKSLIPSIYRKISNRIIEHIPQNKILVFPGHELNSLKNLNRSGFSESSYFSRNQYFQNLIKDSLLKESSVVIGFDTSSWILITKCKKLNIPYILDVSIAHSVKKNIVYTKIFDEYPSWNQTLETKSKDFLDFEQYELNNATHIVVASSFTRNSLIDNGIIADKISINAYGVDLFQFPLKDSFSLFEKVRFIFLGIVDARKGIPILLDIFKQVDNSKANLSIVGSINDKIESIINENYELSNIEIIGKLPHNELPSLLRKHDVFIFPSYFEGFGLVILEAMASGLPVITTTATAGPDIIENGVEGFIIEPGDKEGLRIAINFFIDNPSQIEIMGRAARKKAEQYSWDAYGDRWEKIIHDVIENTNV